MRRFWIVALVIIGVLCIGASGWYFIDRARQEQTVTQINDELRQLKENAGSEGETVIGVTAVRAAEGVHEMPAIAEELLEEDIPEETGTAPGPVPDEPVIVLSMPVAALRLSALKSTHRKLTTSSVYMRPIGAGMFLLSNFISFSPIMRAPYITPHSMKVQFAPCHTPVHIHTTARLNICLFRPLRLPPSGM